jgi:hypothetical protein
MDLSRLTSRAKDLFAKRGGSEAAKQDAQELKDIARSDASLGDKAKAGLDALKDPGAPGEARGPGAGAERPEGEGQRPGSEEQRTEEQRPPAAEQPATEEQPPPPERQRPRH